MIRFEGIDEGWQEKAIEFHLRNPKVYELFVRFTREARDAGAKVGPQAVWERIRWETNVRTFGDPYKVNDAFKAWYSRYAMLREPDLSGYFEIRTRRAA